MNHRTTILSKRIIWGIFLFSVLNLKCGHSFRPYSPVHFNSPAFQAEPPQGAFIAIQKALDNFINEQEIPGLQLAIKFPDQSQWIGTSGTLTLKRKVQLTSDHVLRIAHLCNA